MIKGILFVCIGNSCRSIMAEALTRHHFGALIHAGSAGTYPLGHITAHTLTVLNERHLSTAGLHSKGLATIDFSRYQLIVSLNGESLEGFIPASFPGRLVRWHVHDPYGEGIESFRSVRDQLEWLVTNKVPEWMEPQ
jgi:arsenate reductase (thioredoxin)